MTMGACRNSSCSRSTNPSAMQPNRRAGRSRIGGHIRRNHIMPRESMSQRKTVGRVMHEYAHGELKGGPGGRAGKVKNPRQAIAIALKEAGASKYESPSENKRNYRRSKRKEATGRTAQQETEGKRPVAARARARWAARTPSTRRSARRASGRPPGATSPRRAAR